MPNETATETGLETPDAPERTRDSNRGSISLKQSQARAQP